MALSEGTVCFFVKDQRVLLVEITYPDGRKLWNGIGGMVDPDESPLEAVVREIGEETKLEVTQKYVDERKLITIGDFDLHVFICTSWTGSLEAIDPSLGSFRWFSYDEVPYDQMHDGNDKWLPGLLKDV